MIDPALGGVEASTASSQQEVAVLLRGGHRFWVPSGFSGFLPRSKHMQVNGTPNCPVGVHLRVNANLSPLDDLSR